MWLHHPLMQIRTVYTDSSVCHPSVVAFRIRAIVLEVDITQGAPLAGNGDDLVRAVQQNSCEIPDLVREFHVEKQRRILPRVFHSFLLPTGSTIVLKNPSHISNRDAYNFTVVKSLPIYKCP